MHTKVLITTSLTIFILISSSLSTEWELKYDNGVPYIPNFHIDPGNGWAVLFEDLPQPSGYIISAKIYIGNPPGNTNYEGCDIAIYDVQAGEPGTELWNSYNVLGYHYDTHAGWNTLPVNLEWTFGNFVIVFIQVGYFPSCDGVYNDPAPHSTNSWEFRNNNFTRFTNADLMIRAIWSDVSGAIQSESFGRIKGLFN